MTGAASRRKLLGLAVAGTSFGALSVAGCWGTPVTVHLVRHAEKQTLPAGATPDRDPPLSEAGRRRAEQLVVALAGVKLAAVFATQFKRTQQTIAPAAKANGLPIEVIGADDLQRLVARIREQPGAAVLVVGHSNTVPAIAGALGARESIELGEDDFGDLFVLTAYHAGARVERRRFGA